jgi:hypothetical protein
MTMLRTLLAAVLVLFPATVLACTPNPDPDLRPWGERVAGAPLMFVGTVTEIRGSEGHVWTETPKCESRESTRECKAFHLGFSDVVFTVELPIAGNLKLGDSFVVEQGHGSDCMIEFRPGQRWIYVDHFNDSPSMYLNEAREGLN